MGGKSYIQKLLAKSLFKLVDYQKFMEAENAYLYCKAEKENKEFKFFGDNSFIPFPRMIKNPQYISIGNNFNALYNFRIEAWDTYREQKFNPEITIGDNVSFNTDCHIGCINKIVIGNNVLVASRVYIADHSHGDVSTEALKKPPVLRDLISKGPVVIEDNVWIGEGVCVLPGVTIGKNSIIGANAVVSRDIPANCAAAGIPARVIKNII